MKNEDECTNDEELYSNYTMLRCSDRKTNWIVSLLLMVFILLTNLLLFNLLIAIFSKTFEKIEGMGRTNLPTWVEYFFEWIHIFGCNYVLDRLRWPKPGRMQRRRQDFCSGGNTLGGRPRRGSGAQPRTSENFRKLQEILKKIEKCIIVTWLFNILWKSSC